MRVDESLFSVFYADGKVHPTLPEAFWSAW